MSKKIGSKDKLVNSEAAFDFLTDLVRSLGVALRGPEDPVESDLHRCYLSMNNVVATNITGSIMNLLRGIRGPDQSSCSDVRIALKADKLKKRHTIPLRYIIGGSKNLFGATLSGSKWLPLYTKSALDWLKELDKDLSYMEPDNQVMFKHWHLSMKYAICALEELDYIPSGE